MLKLLFALVIPSLLLGCSEQIEQKATTPLTVSTSNGEVRFMVEIASTPEEMKKGLMYRTEIPMNNGMIFNIYPVRPTAMWMKNTKIALDMLFIAPDATISMIKEYATPMSEEHIISRDPVRAVVELNAGQVKRHGIKIGDKVNHEILNSMITLSNAPNGIVTPSSNNIPKGPNAVPNGPVIPKGPNAVPNGPVIPKGPNAVPNGPVIPKGPNAVPNGPVIPKGPNAPASLPIIPPM